MVVTELETHLRALGLTVEYADAGEQTYVVVRDVPITTGSRAGGHCDVGVLRTEEEPWVPQAALQVKPHLTEMGQNASQGSPLGEDWQYLSRRFDPVPSPQRFYAHMLTVIGEF